MGIPSSAAMTPTPPPVKPLHASALGHGLEALKVTSFQWVPWEGGFGVEDGVSKEDAQGF